MPRKRPAQDLAVGAMFALALVVLALGIMAVGGESGLFFSKVRYFVIFPGADGLVVGAPVRMNGVQIGTVAQIRLPADPTAPGIHVDLAVDKVHAPRIREDSRAALRILQILTNEKFVEIDAGSADQPQMAPNAQIAPLEGVEFFARGEAIAESLSDITLSLKSILEPMQRGEGLIGQLLQDPEFGREGLASLRETLDNLARITAGLRAGHGTVGRLMTDDKLARRLDQAGDAVEHFSTLMESVGRQEGALGELLREDGKGKLLIQDLQAAAASLRRVGAGLESREGLIGKLLNDDEYSEALARDLRATLSDLSDIAHKINAGQGTLGALIHERELYDGATEIVTGVNDSKFARWLARHYRKKGIKRREREGSEQDAADALPRSPGGE